MTTIVEVTPTGTVVREVSESNAALKEIRAAQAKIQADPPSPEEILAQIKTHLMTLPVPVRAKNYTAITNIITAVQRGDFEVAAYILQNDINPETEQEQAVIDAAKRVFGL